MFNSIMGNDCVEVFQCHVMIAAVLFISQKSVDVRDS